MSDQSGAKAPTGYAICSTRQEGRGVDDFDDGSSPEGHSEGKPEPLQKKPRAAPLLAQPARAPTGSGSSTGRPQPPHRFFRNNGLTIVLMLLFLFSLLGMVFSGLSQANETLLRHHQAPLGLLAFLGSGEFLSALLRIGKANFCKWESMWC